MWILRRLLSLLGSRLGLPGQYHLSGKYFYSEGVTFFPAKNRHLVKIPAGMMMHDAFFNVFEEICVEEDVIFGHQVMLLTGMHEPKDGIVSKHANSRGPIRVRKGAWIASRAIILGGVSIGEGSVIGAGSIVTKSVPPGEFWAGNPARKIRTL